MSLIVTTISGHGIIHASDRAVMIGPKGQQHRSKQDSKKTFSVLDFGLVSIAGSESVGGKEFESWLHSFLNRETWTPETFGELALAMREELEAAQQGKPVGQIIHLSGYARTGSNYYPVFYHIRNRDSDKGVYVDPTDDFRCDEDFQRRDYKACKYETIWPLHPYVAHMYTNGWYDGRNAFTSIMLVMHTVLHEIWKSSSLKPPGSLADEKAILNQHFEMLYQLLQISAVENIGGPTDVRSITVTSKGPRID